MSLGGVRVPTRSLVGVLTIVGGVAAGVLASARIDHVGPLGGGQFRLVNTLPLVVYPVAIGCIALLFLARRAWWAGLVIFVVWLPVEDMARKFAGNDIRLYVVKYLLLALAVLNVGPRLLGAWRNSLGNLRGITAAVIGVALVMSIPAILIDPRLPLVGLTVRFLLALLLPVGAFFARDRARLTSGLVVLSAICLPICLLGIVQSVVGPRFLNPAVVDSALSNLVVYRANSVIRPAGPFVDSGRFAALTTVTIVFALCLVRMSKSSRQRNLGWATTAIGVAAAFASGGRAALLISVAFVLFALFSQREKRLRRTTVVLLTGGAVLAGIGLSSAASESFGNRVEFFRATLSPTGPRSELGSRLGYYFTEAGKGIAAGGLTGTGTGSQSIGRQYLGESAPSARSESGWGTVATEWGPIGLLVWAAWAAGWVRRALRSPRVAQREPAGPMLSTATMFIVYCLTFLFSLGAQFFDNYVINGAFWFLSGVVFGSMATSIESSRSAVDAIRGP